MENEAQNQEASPPSLIMTIEVAPGKSDSIEVRPDDSLRALAQSFAEKHGLDQRKEEFIYLSLCENLEQLRRELEEQVKIEETPKNEGKEGVDIEYSKSKEPERKDVIPSSNFKGRKPEISQEESGNNLKGEGSTQTAKKETLSVVKGGSQQIPKPSQVQKEKPRISEITKRLTSPLQSRNAK